MLHLCQHKKYHIVIERENETAKMERMSLCDVVAFHLIASRQASLTICILPLVTIQNKDLFWSCLWFSATIGQCLGRHLSGFTVQQRLCQADLFS
jgi:hypothetical protein